MATRRKALPRTAALSVAITLLAAPIPSAQSPAPGARRPTLRMPGYPVAGAPPIISVLEKGALPRKQLRYDIPATHTALLEVTLSGSMSTTTGGVRFTKGMPTMKATIALRVTGVSPDGDIAYEFAFTGITVKASADMTTKELEDMRDSVAGIALVKGSATVSNRGVLKSVVLDVQDPRLKEVVFQLMSSVESLLVPFPEDAIGVGGRWEVRRAIAAGATGSVLHATTFQSTEYEVASIDGPAVSLKVTIEQTGPPQVVGSLPDSDLNLTKMSASGAGTIALQMNSLVPWSEMTSTIAFSMSASMPQVELPSLAGSTRIRTTIAPSGPALAQDTTFDNKALRGLTTVNLAGSAYSIVGPDRVCYPRAASAPGGALAGVSIAMGGLLSAATQVLSAGNIWTSGRSTDFLEIDAQIHDAAQCEATITLELHRGLGKAHKTTSSNGTVVTGYGRSPVIWRRTFEIAGAPAGFRDRLIARFKLDVDAFVSDVAQANKVVK